MNWFTDLFNRQSHQYTTLFLPKDRVDVAYDDSPLQAGAAYCKLWLVEMRLARDIEWGDTRYPVVHAATSYFYGTNRISVPCVADEAILKGLTTRNRDRIIACNYELTPLFPYKKETISVSSGLFSLLDSSIVKTSIQVMGQLSSLLPVASEFSKLLSMVEPLGNGIRDLLNIQDKRLELGYLQTFAQAGSGGSNLLRPGYFVAIRAEESKIDRAALCIVQDHLRLGAHGHQQEFLRQSTPFADYSYMLFRFEARKERNWDELTDIETLVQNAQEALINDKREEVHNYILPAIKVAIMRSPDITREDRATMIAKIQYTLERSGLQGTAPETAIRSLYAIMQQPLPATNPQLNTEIDQLRATFEVE